MKLGTLKGCNEVNNLACLYGCYAEEGGSSSQHALQLINIHNRDL
jgi:hypothetical protein